MFYCNSSQWATAPGDSGKVWTKCVYSDSYLTCRLACFTGRGASFNFTWPVASVCIRRGGVRKGEHKKDEMEREKERKVVKEIAQLFSYSLSEAAILP